MTTAPALTYPMFTQRPNGDIYNWHLSAVERLRGRVYDPSFALASDPLVYEKMLRVPVIKHGVVQRAAEVAGREWTCVPASEDEADVRLARVVRDLLGHIGHFDAARNRLAQAFFYGSAYEEMRGDFQCLKLSHDDRVRRWYVVTDLKNVDRRRFTRWHVALGPKQSSEWVMWGAQGGKWSPIDNPELFVKHTYDDREQYLGFGSGVADALFWCAYALTVAEREGLAGLERWSQGWIIAKVGEDRAASVSRTNDDIVEEWRDKLVAQRSRHVLVHGASDEVQVVETSGSGHRICIEFCEMLKSDATRLLTGSLRPTGGGGGSATGARAQASVEADSSEAIYRLDQSEADEVWTHDLIGYVCDMNRPILREMGLGHARRPRFATVRQKNESPTENATVAATLLGAGVRLVEEDVYTKTGFRMPKPGEKVIEPRAPVAVPFGA